MRWWAEILMTNIPPTNGVVPVVERIVPKERDPPPSVSPRILVLVDTALTISLESPAVEAGLCCLHVGCQVDHRRGDEHCVQRCPAGFRSYRPHRALTTPRSPPVPSRRRL